MRKPAFCICENTGADKLRGYPRSLSALLFSLHRYFLNPKFQAYIAIFYGCTALLVSDLVGNHEDRFSRDAALII